MGRGGARRRERGSAPRMKGPAVASRADRSSDSPWLMRPIAANSSSAATSPPASSATRLHSSSSSSRGEREGQGGGGGRASHALASKSWMALAELRSAAFAARPTTCSLRLRSAPARDYAPCIIGIVVLATVHLCHTR